MCGAFLKYRTIGFIKISLALRYEKTTLVFDTSVFGGIHDIEFKIETEQLFEMVRAGDIICVYSDLSEFELENAPEKIKTHF